MSSITGPQCSDSFDSHFRAAVAAANLVTDPGPHTVISDVLPTETYNYLLESIPPPEVFEVADSVKANFDPIRATKAPEPTRHTWLWFQNDVVAGVLTPILIEAFRPCLRASYESYFGAEYGPGALDLDHRAFRGRLMLRRPGYRLKPHRDEKIAVLTGLVYFSRPGDNHQYGTDLYRVHKDQQAPFMKTYYPEGHGARAELARSVPFAANTALVFMNVPGMAHGAHIPSDATQLTRYAYQFYVGPKKSKMARFLRRIPPERARTWGDPERSCGES